MRGAQKCNPQNSWCPCPSHRHRVTDTHPGLTGQERAVPGRGWPRHRHARELGECQHHALGEPGAVSCLWPRRDRVPPTFRKPRPRCRQASSRSTLPSFRPAASQHSAGKNQPRPRPRPVHSSCTITWLRYQAGEAPRLSCQRRTFRSGPSGAGVLRTHTRCQQTE